MFGSTTTRSYVGDLFPYQAIAYLRQSEQQETIGHEMLISE